MKNKTKRLTESAMLIALGVVLEFAGRLVIPPMPFGGQLTLVSMLPIVLISYRHGVKWGLTCGVCYALIEMAIGAKTVTAAFQPGYFGDGAMIGRALLMCLLDYLLAYTLVGLGDFSNPRVLLAIIGLIITIVLVVWNVNGGLFISILATSAIAAVMQYAMQLPMGLPESVQLESFPSLAPTFGQFFNGFGELIDVNQGVGVAIFSLISVLISLTMVDMFDTVGTLYGTAGKAGFLTKEGKLPNASRALLADAIATSTGAVMGTSTVTTFVESSAGISAGGRTGLTSVTTAVCFVIAIFLSPFLGFIPSEATSPVLVLVGVMMMGGVRDVDWNDMEIAIPAFLTIAMMPFAYSISEGIAFGCISYTIIKMCRGKFKEVHPVMYVISALFIVRYILLIVNA